MKTTKTKPVKIKATRKKQDLIARRLRKIGKIGGKRTKELYGFNFYRKIGKKGGLNRVKNEKAN